MRRAVKPACIIGALGVAFLGTAVYLKNWRSATHELWDKVRIGDPEEHVRSVLGNPEREYEHDDAPVDYYIRGYGRKERGISSKVLIYRQTDMILYVWIDRSGRVEDIFRGTS